jgi:hypothetical protein
MTTQDTEFNQNARKPIERPEIRMNDANWRSYQRYVGKKLLAEGSGLVGPAGVVIDNRPWRGFKHSVQVQTFVMNRPTELLLEPDPRCKYVWRPREDPKHSTEALVGRGCLRPVEMSEVDEASELRMWCYEYSGSGGKDADGDPRITGLVAVGDMALFEVAPRWAYEWFDAAVDETFSRLGSLEPGFKQDAEDFAARNRGMRVHKSSINVEEDDTQTVGQEIRNPIGPGAPFAHAAKSG